MNTFKFKLVPTILAVGISALAAYGYYSCCEGGESGIAIAIGGFLMLFASLFGLMGFSYDKAKHQSLIRVVSSIFMLVALISNILFCTIGFSMPAYIIVNGILTLIYILTVYQLDKTSI